MIHPFRPTGHSKTLIRTACLGLLFSLGSCMQYVTQQGNVLKPEKVAQIREQDSRFNVEMLIGSPVLKDDLHPNRVIYVDDYNNPDTGEKYQRRVEIIYNESGRVKSIKRFGFGQGKSGAEDDKASAGE